MLWAGPLVLIFNRCGGMLGKLFRFGNLFSGHFVFFVGPRAEVEKFATFGTERAERIIIPGCRLIADRALHKNPLAYK